MLRVQPNLQMPSVSIRCSLISPSSLFSNLQFLVQPCVTSLHDISLTVDERAMCIANRRILILVPCIEMTSIPGTGPGKTALTTPAVSARGHFLPETNCYHMDIKDILHSPTQTSSPSAPSWACAQRKPLPFFPKATSGLPGALHPKTSGPAATK